MFFEDLSQFSFIQNALWAIIFMSVTCSIVGAYVVVRRLVFLSGGITHASFGGIGIAYYLGLNPLLGAMIFSIISVLGFEAVTLRDKKVREDSVIGVLWALGMAIGILFIFMTPGYAPNLMSFLFGNILTVTDDLLIYNGVLAAVMVILFKLFYRPIVFVAFDRDYALSQRVPTAVINSIMLIFVAITIVLTLKLVGIMLLVSMLTIPPITLARFCSSFKGVVIGSMVVTFIGSFLGLLFSLYYDIPTSAAIIVVLSLFYLTSLLVGGVLKKVKA